MRALSLLLAVALLLSCSAPETSRTELVLVIDSDLAVPAELSQLVVRTDGPGARSQSASASLGEGEAELPRSLVLSHLGGPLGPIVIHIEGKLDGEIVLTREAEVSFVPGRSLLLPLHLARSCLTRACEEAETCTERGCRDLAVDEDTLVDWTGDKPALAARDPENDAEDASAEPELDGSAEPELDGSVEPELDASVMDAAPGLDASVPSDAGKDASVRVDGGDTGEAGQCLPRIELCNGADDDCNGRIDDGFNLASDENNCGRCGVSCNVRRGDVCCRGACARSCQ